MKFSNGCWLQKEGCSCFAPQEVYFTKIEERKVTLLAPTIHIVTRGDTLGCINLTMEITSPAPDIFRVRTYHFKGAVVETPAFDLELTEELPLEVEDDEEKIKITSGSMSLVITKKTWSMTYMRGNEVITKSAGKDLALMKMNFKGYTYDKGDGEDTYIRQMLSLSVGELVYGMGERFTPFVKNGQSVDIWNEDGGTSTEQSYKNIPFYITNKGYGVLVNHPERVSFEVATEMVTRTEFSVKGSYLDYFLINGPTMKEVLTRYTDLTGKPSLPAPWTFGLWLSTSFTTNYDEETVMSFVDGMLNRGIPLRTFHFDCFWMKEFHWSDFLWDSRVFPDPAGMLKRIKAKGLNICVWINPYIGQESYLFDEGMKNGYLIKRTNGQVWQWDAWQPGMAIVDFTNPAACKWFQDKLEVLLDMGVDCFKTDFGERIPTENVAYSDGSDPVKMHNLYTYLYNKCVFDLLERKRGKGQAVLFARSATVGGQKFPVHWGGDCWSDYESMEESLHGGLSLLMSGFGFWAHDIGGFESTSTADVYKRWVTFGLLSSHSRLHGSSSYRVPWVYDEEAVDVVRFFTRLKASLMPYLYKTAIDTSRSGVPTMRSMVLEYTEDKTCHYVDKQYMLGDNLLVAPIFNDQSIAEYYLPTGTWTDFFTGEEKEGAGWITEKHGYLSIPLMVKENSIVVMGAHDDRPDYDYGDHAEIRIYALKDGHSASSIVYGMDNQEQISITASRSGSDIHIQVTSGQEYTIRLINVTASGKDAVIDGKDTVISLSGNADLVVTEA
ncbi:alpha-glucosidases family 31 of glycosyl hydrolases [Firmicutes bacterium CAG:534]|nr:alpha-glucosidases family 31 of glycosyl hydrolases [Firmicutes bacterium CAG:534]